MDTGHGQIIDPNHPNYSYTEDSDVVNTLLLTIFKHFVGDSSAIKDRNNELLLNIKCKSMIDFQWYKDTFLSRIMHRHDCNNLFGNKSFYQNYHIYLEKR